MCKSVFSVQSAPRQVFLRNRKSHRGTTADEKKAQTFHGGQTSIAISESVLKVISAHRLTATDSELGNFCVRFSAVA